MTENENAKLLWNYSIRTDRVIKANHPDLNLVDKESNKVSLKCCSSLELKSKGERARKKGINNETYELSSGDYGISQ